MNKPIQTIEKDILLSNVISYLRFPMIVAVVLIHTQIGMINGMEGDMSASYPFGGAYPIYESVLYLFVKILTRIAVPMFFLFSGFLFFYKLDEFTIATYFSKLKKRIHTLLIPYIFWNILYFLMFYMRDLLFPNAIKSDMGGGINDFLLALWDYKGSRCPINYPFWFIRDLIVMVLSTPIIYWLIKKLKYLFPLLLGVLWLAGLWFDVVGFSIDAFFFFSLGAYFAIYKHNFATAVKDHSVLLGALYFICILIAFITNNYDWNIYIRKLSILLGGAFALAISASYIAKDKLRVNAFLSESSFFIFAYHIIALHIVNRILIYIIPCTTDTRAVISHFLCVLIIVLGGVLLYYLLRRFFPKTTTFITGGR